MVKIFPDTWILMTDAEARTLVLH